MTSIGGLVAALEDKDSTRTARTVVRLDAGLRALGTNVVAVNSLAKAHPGPVANPEPQDFQVGGWRHSSRCCSNAHNACQYSAHCRPRMCYTGATRWRADAYIQHVLHAQHVRAHTTSVQYCMPAHVLSPPSLRTRQRSCRRTCASSPRCASCAATRSQWCSSVGGGRSA